MSYSDLMRNANNSNMARATAAAAQPPPPSTPAPIGQETIWDSLTARLDEMGKNFLGSQVQVINGCIDMTMACMKRVDDLERQLAAYTSKLPCTGAEKTAIEMLDSRTAMLLSSFSQQQAVNDDLRKRLLALETRSDTWGLAEGRVATTDGRITKLGDSIKGVVDELDKRVISLEKHPASASKFTHDSLDKLDDRMVGLEKSASDSNIDLSMKISLAYQNIAGLDRRMCCAERRIDLVEDDLASCEETVAKATDEVEKASQLLERQPVATVSREAGEGNRMTVTSDPALIEFMRKYPNWVLLAPGPTGAAGLL